MSHWELQEMLEAIIELLFRSHPCGLRVLVGEIPAPSFEDLVMRALEENILLNFEKADQILSLYDNNYQIRIGGVDMNIEFSLLLILLLPGFLSLWIYKQITVEDIDRRGEWTQVALGFCFGVLNLFIYSLISKTINVDVPIIENMTFQFQ